jgi:hypothetical protein
LAWSFLPLSIDPTENWRDDVMTQLPLFPPPVAPGTPLPSKIRREVRDLVAELMIAVIVASAETRPARGKDSHE